MPSIGRNVLGNLPEAIKLEWLVTNGLGGFASSSIAGMNTRRYHGVLVATRAPPVERILLVSRLEETLIYGGIEYPLSTNRYLKALHPSGYLFLERFESDPIPTWTYQINDVLLSKSLFMVYGHNTTVVTYKLFSSDRCVDLIVRPHFLFRDFHGNAHENPGFEDNSSLEEHGLSLMPFANAPKLFVAWDRGEFLLDGHWYKQNYLGEEDRRGLDPIEDDYSNGFLRVSNLSGNASIMFSDEPISSFNAIDLRKREERRRETIVHSVKTEDLFLQKLLIAADQFVVDRASTKGKSIIAGYPWFSDWGRDSLISIPGITLIPGRFDDARSILRSFAESIRNGLVPNCFADYGNDALYNSGPGRRPNLSRRKGLPTNLDGRKGG
ncbi:glycogen debranching enzyme family protein [bacterium]|nr:glycogen debranching enzyme family protein [bacterium]